MTPLCLKAGWKSDEAVCLNPKALCEVAKQKSVTKHIEGGARLEVEFEGEKTITDRKMVLVDLAGKRTAWADRITGQLYAVDTGKCLSGDLRLAA